MLWDRNTEDTMDREERAIPMAVATIDRVQAYLLYLFLIVSASARATLNRKAPRDKASPANPT